MLKPRSVLVGAPIVALIALWTISPGAEPTSETSETVALVALATSMVSRLTVVTGPAQKLIELGKG